MCKTISGRSATRLNPVATIFRIGLIAGTLDITENLIFNAFRGITPAMVFQYIATGLIGMKAIDLGAASIALGVVLHYTIALIWTAVFYVASGSMTILLRRPVISGLLYDAFVYLFMNFAVLPLSGVPHAKAAMAIASRVSGVLAILLCIGLTISLLVRRSTALR